MEAQYIRLSLKNNYYNQECKPEKILAAACLFGGKSGTGAPAE